MKSNDLKVKRYLNQAYYRKSVDEINDYDVVEFNNIRSAMLHIYRSNPFEAIRFEDVSIRKANCHGNDIFIKDCSSKTLHLKNIYCKTGVYVWRCYFDEIIFENVNTHNISFWNVEADRFIVSNCTANEKSFKNVKFGEVINDKNSAPIFEQLQIEAR